MEPNDCLYPDKDNYNKDGSNRDNLCCPHVTWVQDTDVSGPTPSSIVFTPNKQLVYKFHLMFIALWITSLIFVLLLAYFDLLGRVHSLVDVILVCSCCLCVFGVLHLILHIALMCHSIVLSRGGIDVKIWIYHQHISWKKVSHYILHYSPILLWLALVDQNGKKIMFINGFYDCVAIAEAIKEIGIPERSER